MAFQCNNLPHTMHTNHFLSVDDSYPDDRFFNDIQIIKKSPKSKSSKNKNNFSKQRCLRIKNRNAILLNPYLNKPPKFPTKPKQQHVESHERTSNIDYLHFEIIVSNKCEGWDEYDYGCGYDNCCPGDSGPPPTASGMFEMLDHEWYR